MGGRWDGIDECKYKLLTFFGFVLEGFVLFCLGALGSIVGFIGCLNDCTGILLRLSCDAA